MLSGLSDFANGLNDDHLSWSFAILSIEGVLVVDVAKVHTETRTWPS
jgi:hypothetical protein